VSDADPFNLERFVTAQAPVFANVLAELEAGRKQSHWMWFVFPQLRGLGHSSMARFYAIADVNGARAYLAHPLLGPRLELCTRTVLRHPEKSLHLMFGSPDDMKFQSCMTLFALAVVDPVSVFNQALDQCCSGVLDPQTLKVLNAVGPSWRR
jgi:uncharacterized protein (DUF1810 family)